MKPSHGPLVPPALACSRLNPNAPRSRRRPVRKRIAAGRRHEIDGAAERVGAELQCIGALVDRDIFVGGGIDFLEIAIAVGGVDRNPVHVELDAAQMEVARQAGTADREPGIVAPFGLRKDAGDVVENVLDGVGDGRIPVGLGGNDSDAAGGLLNVAQRLLHGEDRQRGSPRLIARDSRGGGIADAESPARRARRYAAPAGPPLRAFVEGRRR